MAKRYTQPQSGPFGADPTFHVVDIPSVYSVGLTSTLNGTAKYDIGVAGERLNIVAVGDFVSHGTNAALQLSKQSGVMVVQVGSLSAAQALYTTNYTVTNDGFIIQITTAGKVEIDKKNTTAVCVSSNAVTAGSIAYIAWSYDSATGVCSIGLNGVVTTATVATVLTHGTVVRGRFRSSDTLSSNPHSQYLFVLSRLTRAPAEIASLSANPWQIFAAQSRVLRSGGITVVQPSSDVSAGAWTPSTGVTLFGCVDETPYSDTDYISTASASTCEMDFPAFTFPVTAGVTLSYRAASADGSTLTVSLKQSGSTVASWAHTLTSTVTQYNDSLTAPQIATITDPAVNPIGIVFVSS